MACEMCEIPLTGKFDVELTGSAGCAHCNGRVEVNQLARYDGKVVEDGVTKHQFSFLIPFICPSCKYVKLEWLIKPCKDSDGHNFWMIEDLKRHQILVIDKDGFARI